MGVPAQAERGGILPSSAFLFCSHPPLTAQLPTLVRPDLYTQSTMLISSGHILTDTPRNNVLPAFWASLSSVKLTQN